MPNDRSSLAIQKATIRIAHRKNRTIEQVVPQVVTPIFS